MVCTLHIIFRIENVQISIELRKKAFLQEYTYRINKPKTENNEYTIPFTF